MHDFATHEKEIDDIDFSPDSARLLSVSKDKVSLHAVLLLAKQIAPPLFSCFTSLPHFREQ